MNPPSTAAKSLKVHFVRTPLFCRQCVELLANLSLLKAVHANWVSFLEMEAFLGGFKGMAKGKQ